MAIKDLTGQRFGKLVAIRGTDERIHGSAVWECKCDCGKTAFVNAYSLRSGATKSCGCMKGKKPADLTGQRFGQLTAIKPTNERQNGSVIWECKCDCGNITYAKAIELRSKHVQSCGCLSRNKPLDLTGQRFGQLTAVKPTDERRYKNVIWECKCDCGRITYVSAHNLQSGGSNSCGCKKGRRGTDLTGQRYGYLTAIEPTERRMASNIIWKCRCDCGSITYVSAHNLRSGGTISCGCAGARKKVLRDNL